MVYGVWWVVYGVWCMSVLLLLLLLIVGAVGDPTDI
jgi:hypothetical protein